MKYLKRVNESKSYIVEYIEQCFINLIDDGYKFEDDIYKGDHTLSLIIDVPDQNRYSTANLVETANFLLEKSLEVETSIKKVQLRYPDINFVTCITLNGDYPDLHIETVFEF